MYGNDLQIDGKNRKINGRANGNEVIWNTACARTLLAPSPFTYLEEGKNTPGIVRILHEDTKRSVLCVDGRDGVCEMESVRYTLLLSTLI